MIAVLKHELRLYFHSLTAYVLEGHGETELPATFLDQVEKENIEVTTFSLLTVDEVPEEADCVMLYAPESDISEAEAEMLAAYVSDGGKLVVMAGPVEDASLDNLYGLLANYGVTANEGIVVEGDRNYYAFQMLYVLLPDLGESDITAPLAEAGYFVFMPISTGLTLPEEAGAATVTPLLTTSEAAFSKIAGYGLETYEKEEGDLDGPFTLGVSIQDGEGQMVWLTSSYFLDDMYNAYSSGANVDMGMNILSALIGEREAISIRSKSLNYNYLTISESAASTIKVLLIGVFPLAYLGIGIGVVLYRRRRQNEAR